MHKWLTHLCIRTQSLTRARAHAHTPGTALGGIIARTPHIVCAHTVALMLVEMERSYITAGFFRHTMHNRSNRIKAQQAMARAAEQGQVQQVQCWFGFIVRTA